MILLDISGNEIHGKEVVFTHYVNQIGVLEPKGLPLVYEKIIHLGTKPSGMDVFSAYRDNTPIPFLYFGKLKDKI